MEAVPAVNRPTNIRFRQWMLKTLTGTGQIWRANFSVPISVAARRVKIPILLGNGLQNLDVDLFEPWLLETLRRLFAARRGAFLDVGVNVGQTLIKAKALDPLRPYYGFEPDAGCCQYVEQLIRINNFPNCTIVPAALSDRGGIATLRSHADVALDPCATLVDGFPFGHEGLDQLRVATLLRGDDVIARLGVEDVAVVKIDVEGAELDVLRGLERTLRERQPYIICEILPVMDAEPPAGRLRLARQEAAVELLRALGYAVFRIHDDAAVERIERIEVHASLALSNYVFAPASEVGLFLDRFEQRHA